MGKDKIYIVTAYFFDKEKSITMVREEICGVYEKLCDAVYEIRSNLNRIFSESKEEGQNIKNIYIRSWDSNTIGICDIERVFDFDYSKNVVEEFNKIIKLVAGTGALGFPTHKWVTNLIVYGTYEMKGDKND